jgi:enoyl-CoA hydratase
MSPDAADNSPQSPVSPADSTWECFDVDLRDGVAHVRLNRPEAYNSMVPAFWTELPAIVEGLDAAGTTRVMVLSSTGKHFSAGMDLAVFTEGGLGGASGVSEQGRRNAGLWLMVQHLQRSFTALANARFPVLAAVQGGCIGGAVDMVAAADCRYGTEDSFVCIQEINIAMTADVGTLQRLGRLVPEGVAREWAYTGDRIPAGRVREVGFFNETFADHEALVAGVLEIAGRIAAQSPLAIWGTKEAISYARDHSTADALHQMAGWQSGMFQPGDMMEAFTAKGEKRAPVFEGLPPLPGAR